MTALRISSHAISRYRSRVEPVDYDTAHAALSSPIVQAAARFGCSIVRLPTGQRIVIENYTVVTVLPAEQFKRQIQRQGVGRYHTTPKTYQKRR